MRRAGSLFDIDQEPLFEAATVDGSFEAEPGVDEAVDEIPPALDLSVDLMAAGLGRRSPTPRRCVRLLLAVGAIGAVGFLGSRLTQETLAPSDARQTARDAPAVVAAAPAARPSPSVPVGLRAHRRRRNSLRARQRGSTRRANRPARTQHRRRAFALPRSRPQVFPPAPVPPPAPEPAPEPQGFLGEFF